MKRRLPKAYSVRIFVLAIAATALAYAPAAAAPPQAALRAGYTTQTFSTKRFTFDNVDLNGSDKSGYQWYRMNFFRPRSELKLTRIDDGDLITGGLGFEGAMTTATKTSSWPYFAGVAFGGGGYFEAEISFDSEKVNLKEGVWPAWWSLTLESILEIPETFWKGQPSGYFNTIEVDFFEYDLQGSLLRTRNQYGAGIHHWYGTRGMCAKTPLCGYGSPYASGIQTGPSDIDWMKFHKFGALWIPAKADRLGSMTFFLDGKQSNEPITWKMFNDEPPPPTSKTPWAFGPLDRLHLILVLSSGQSSPIRVRSVEVWQADDSQNLRH